MYEFKSRWTGPSRNPKVRAVPGGGSPEHQILICAHDVCKIDRLALTAVSDPWREARGVRARETSSYEPLEIDASASRPRSDLRRFPRARNLKSLSFAPLSLSLPARLPTPRPARGQAAPGGGCPKHRILICAQDGHQHLGFRVLDVGSRRFLAQSWSRCTHILGAVKGS